MSGFAAQSSVMGRLRRGHAAAWAGSGVAWLGVTWLGVAGSGVFWSGVACGLAGCGSPSTAGGIDAPVSAARLAGIQAVAQSGDPDAAPMLIASLDSDDIAVRTAAIAALERLTGETLGYRADAPLAARRAATDRWAARFSEPVEGRLEVREEVE